MKLSVVMPVFNGDRYLSESIDSVLSQTFSDFEFIIVLEYSSNKESVRIIEGYSDKRIKTIINPEKYGLPKSLNIGFEAAHGEYIARMDADDISLPDRFEKQIAFMDSNPDISVCGTASLRIGRNGFVRARDIFPANHEQIKADLLFFCALRHPTVMFRREAALRYDESYLQSEDYELWCRGVQYTTFANMPDILLRYRWFTDGATQTNKNQSIIKHIQVMDANFRRLGIDFTRDELENLCSMTAEFSFATFKTYKANVESCLVKIRQANDVLKLYDISALEATFNKRFAWRTHPVRQFAGLVLRSAFKWHREANHLEQHGFVATFWATMGSIADKFI